MRIALSGKMKSGKTTLASALWRLPKGGFSIISFADPIRRALLELGIKKESYPDLYRRGAQYIGTELCRAYDENWWVEQMNVRLWGFPDNHNLVIDDVRFQNEYDYCWANGFLMVRLDVTDTMQYDRGAEEGTLEHPSETGLDHIPRKGWDVWIPPWTTVEERLEMILSSLPKASPSPSGSENPPLSPST